MPKTATFEKSVSKCYPESHIWTPSVVPNTDNTTSPFEKRHDIQADTTGIASN